ncbi:protein tyrosine/serine phosphatase [Caballeronia terrestris]|uniref:Protein tyrosine/serine phosphatase n=1 Tax=Caballeronia terrestris TaxID=1226301 RepID=A0A158KB48_9BURK|nr:tyrosine-protein phosphatase [Caballeronia terrestris]SAL77943.1 protein tyrosine/serine phosphatase [Caballeronia terrestris]
MMPFPIPRGATLTRRAFLHGGTRAALMSVAVPGLGASLLSACGGASDNTQVTDTPRLASVENFRDVSGSGDGYPTADGRRLRRGVFYRSGALTSDANDAATLDRLQLRVVHDLRTVNEASLAPDRVPSGATREPVDIAPLNAQATVPTSEAAARAWMIDAQRRLVTDATARAHFGALLTRLANTPGPQIIHGATGKDRTGWAAALLLAIAGSPLDVIVQDYLLTNSVAASAIAARIEAHAARANVSGAFVAPLYRAESATLEAAFDQMQQSFGTLNDYLLKGLNVAQADVGMLRAKLVL